MSIHEEQHPKHVRSPLPRPYVSSSSRHGTEKKKKKDGVEITSVRSRSKTNYLISSIDFQTAPKIAAGAGMNLSLQVSIFDNSTSGVLRWSTHLEPPTPPPPPSLHHHHLRRLFPPCSHAGIPFTARVFVCVCVCIPDVHLTASLQASHDPNNIVYSLPMFRDYMFKSIRVYS